VNADELVSAIVDDGAEPAIPAEEREAVAQRLFLHGLLLAAHRPAPAMRRWKLPAASAAAAVLVMGLVLYLARDTMPAADATVERARKALEGDQHYVSQVYLDDEPQFPRPFHWYIRADRWALSTERPMGTHWFGGDAETVWWVSPRGAHLELPKSRLPELPAELDPTLLHGNLYDALSEMRTFTLSTVAREGGRIHVRGVRRDPTDRGPKQVDLWCDEATGRAMKAELLFEPPNRPPRKHVLEYVDSDRRPDDFYRPSGHRR
jgi:hypothetical protein